MANASVGATSSDFQYFGYATSNATGYYSIVSGLGTGMYSVAADYSANGSSGINERAHEQESLRDAQWNKSTAETSASS